MSVIYSQTAITARLNGVVTAIGATGSIQLLVGGSVVSTIPLANPCGTVAAGVLTFTVPRSDTNAAGNGLATGATVNDSVGNIMISGLTVGIPLSSADIIINNGVNTTMISTG